MRRWDHRIHGENNRCHSELVQNLGSLLTGLDLGSVSGRLQGFQRLDPSRQILSKDEVLVYPVHMTA